MREHLFRGKRTDNGEWVYGYYFKTPLTEEATGAGPKDGYYFLCGQTRYCIATENGCVYEVIPETVGEYVGQPDKNGKNVCEGDVLRYTWADGRQAVAVVRYDEGYYRFCNLMIKSFDGFSKDTHFSNGEVIGNINDNPELLEVVE